MASDPEDVGNDDVENEDGENTEVVSQRSWLHVVR